MDTFSAAKLVFERAVALHAFDPLRGFGSGLRDCKETWKNLRLQLKQPPWSVHTGQRDDTGVS